jgi:acid phosphatase
MRFSVLLAAAFLAVFLTGAVANLSFTIYGDWGVANKWSNTLAKVSEKHHSKFILALGDNFYREKGKHRTPMGIKSATDPKWKRVYENVYRHKFFKNTWYVCAGNHDYNGNERAQIEYGKKHSRWHFPSLYYTFQKKVGSITADFFVLDTTPLYYSEKELKKTFHYNKGKDTTQIKWLSQQLQASKAKWKIVMAHHQIITGRGGNAYMKQHLAPLLKKHKVAAYLNGHIHNVQHVVSAGTNYMTIGNAAFQKPAAKGRAKWVFPSSGQMHGKTCRNKGCLGFAIMTISSSNKAAVYYYNRHGRKLKTIAIRNPN